LAETVFETWFFEAQVERELRPIQFEFTRRSRMVDFRRWILALAVLALFAGLASAQNAQLSCATNVSSTPQLRAEGLTEQTGDITITCTGGHPATLGVRIPTVNISVFLNTNVTSRLFSTAPNISEALLLIDEPGSPNPPLLAGFGTGAPQRVCGVAGTFFVDPTTQVAQAGGPATGCTEFATAAASVTPPGFAAATDTVATDAIGGTTAGANVFQGIVNPDGIHPNLVTFFGIPVLPPASAGFSRVFRITNIRANASVFGGNVANTQQIVATLAVSDPSALPITNTLPVVGLVQSGLATTATPGTGQVGGTACLGGVQSLTTINTLTFSERFGTAFKPRVDPLTNATFTNQNVPGATYNSESGFVLVVPAGTTTATAGLADWGTRLKATFHGLPAGTTLKVSLANTGGTGSAVLVSGGETAADPAALVPPADGTIAVDSTGTATAVWEVISTSPSALDTMVFTATTVFASSTTPVTTPVTVNLSFAPTPPAFTSASGIVATTAALIPRFADLSTGSGFPIVNVSACRTILLYPFVTTAPPFDTGIAIANTSLDPFGTAPQSGACTLNWFAATAGTTSPAAITTPSVLAGNQFLMIMSQTPAVANFTGYMIASCNFQYAHGFAFVSDLGTRNFAMGYLPLIIPDPNLTVGGTGRVASPGAQATPGSGESNSH
jgi:hypothetical protein